MVWEVNSERSPPYLLLSPAAPFLSSPYHSGFLCLLFSFLWFHLPLILFSMCCRGPSIYCAMWVPEKWLSSYFINRFSHCVSYRVPSVLFSLFYFCWNLLGSLINSILVMLSYHFSPSMCQGLLHVIMF